jgi:hypothetical protein
MRAEYEKFVYNGNYDVSYPGGFDSASLTYFANHLNKLKALLIDMTYYTNIALRHHITDNMISKSATAILDIALRFKEIDGFLGLMFEGLGYGELNGKYHNLYGPIKDIALLGLLKAGFSPIYIARHQSSKNSEEVVHDWYIDHAENIGKCAPLLTETQLGTLVTLLVENPDMSMEDILKDLAINYEDKYDHLFKTEADAIAFQELFGIELDGFKNFKGFTSEMQTWWDNYHLSGSPELPNGKPNLNYWQSVYNLQ